jgi:hypothetical protein
MLNFTILNFWKRRLAVQRVPTATLVRGWCFENDGLRTFKEAPLALSVELSSDADPIGSPILLVSAPGAVGKSTLARQIAFETGAVYVDLAEADPVGGNTLSGGLVRSGLYAQWQAETTAVLIDGLDEARLRVTQDAFEAFLADVDQLSVNRAVPTVLFGRTGAIQDAWLLLHNSAALEIGYYGPEAAADFAEARLREARPNSPHALTERKAIELLLSRLRDHTVIDGDRFAGYAPVLQAVVERVVTEGNAGALVAEIEAGAQPITLNTVVSAILERERGKLSTLRLSDPRLADALYSPDEQLDRLVARVYQQPPPDLPVMGANDAHIYDAALKTWVAEHPFLGGRDAPSSASSMRQLALGPCADPHPQELRLSASWLAAQLLTHFWPNFIHLISKNLVARSSLLSTSASFIGPSVLAFHLETRPVCSSKDRRMLLMKKRCVPKSRSPLAAVAVIGRNIGALSPIRLDLSASAHRSRMLILPFRTRG